VSSFRQRSEPEHELAVIPGRSSHGAGLCEVIALASELGLPAAHNIAVLAVEAADCSTLGVGWTPPLRQSNKTVFAVR